MSLYERRRRGNALRGDARRLSRGGNADHEAKGLWALGGRSDRAVRTLCRDKQRVVNAATKLRVNQHREVDVCQHLSYTVSWEGPQRKAEVKTGLGKTRCPGLQGGLWKRMRYGSRTEAHREIDGYATGPYDCMRATFLSRHTTT